VEECTIDNSEHNYPYDSETFALIRRLAWQIKHHARNQKVPAIAVAGSIADEYNVQRGARRWVDWLQDHAIISNLPSSWIGLDYQLGFHSKFLNVMRNDLGPANINVFTGAQMFALYRDQFPKSVRTWSELVDYIISEEGAVVVASLVIRKGMKDLAQWLSGRPPEIQEALLVTYFKQGVSYVDRFKSRLQRQAPGGNAELKPGEGCRVFQQRAALQGALGL
jgi:hypothetical protein